MNAAVARILATEAPTPEGAPDINEEANTGFTTVQNQKVPGVCPPKTSRHDTPLSTWRIVYVAAALAMLMGDKYTRVAGVG